MSTLDALQKLNPEQFHRVGDDVLRRLEPRYRRLRTHGLNERGKSIQGQPDSYVGDTADTCTIAVAYTTERECWWNKVVDDVKDAIAASPNVVEIVAVIPHNADRDGPKRRTRIRTRTARKRSKKVKTPVASERNDWVAEARAAAGRATFRSIDGRELAQLLDTPDYHDLRYEHLGIPYSRLGGPSILASAKVATDTVIEAIRESGRYESDHYISRSADPELYRLWQQCLRKDWIGNQRTDPVRMIALVNDSGVGKTSLVCSFAGSHVKVLPVVLVQARDMAFGTEYALVAHVVHALQGVLAPEKRVIEEAAIARHLVGSMPLALIVDGLDEAHDTEYVRKAITYWLRSPLGQASVLIVTCRPEFWKMCSDQSWRHWMPGAVSDQRSPVHVADRARGEQFDRDDAVRLPDRFTETELEAAWVKAGRSRLALYALPADAREELRHPFTLRVYLDVYSERMVPPAAVNRAELMEAWLNRRLEIEAEADVAKREKITPGHFQHALRIVAVRIANTNEGSVSVDDLADAGVPRFDSAHPPGPVVARLIGANILETVPGRIDRIRFAIEAVQDFYRAEADVEDIKADSATVVQRFTKLNFSEACPRLVRIGRRIANDEIRHLFGGTLAEIDPRMAAVVICANPLQYHSETRAKVAQSLGRDMTARHRVRGAFAITMLGEMDCPEAVEVLVRHLLPPADAHKYLNTVGATAFAKLGHSDAVDFVYRWEWFGVRPGNETYYDREKLALLRRAKPDFRQALGDHAARQLDSPTGSREHAKAICVLAYLGDDRLVEHLQSRFVANGHLERYENHALVALGSDAAGALFVRSVLAVAKQLAAIPNGHAHNDERFHLGRSVHFASFDIRYLITPAFESHLLQLIEDDNPTIASIGSYWAKSGLVASLFFPSAVASAKRGRCLEFERNDERCAVTADRWLGWWRTATDIAVRKNLMSLLPLYPTPEIEEILLDCLDEPELRYQAARRIGDFGAVRSAQRLRRLLEEDIPFWDRMAAADALGHLRDPGAVPLLESLAAMHRNTDEGLYAVTTLGFIGTPEAESALCRLDDNTLDEELMMQALIACGTATAMQRVIARAKQRTNGTHWLCERIDRLSWERGWIRGNYFTHIHTRDLVEYLDAGHHTNSSMENWTIVDSFRQIDSLDTRQLLRKWAERRGTPEDPLVRENDQRRMSDMCFWELTARGDEFAIPYVLDSWADDDDDTYVSIAARDLRNFSSPAIAAEVRRRLSEATDRSQAVRMLALLGRFGDASDGKLIARFLDHSDDLLANVACESLLRLTDPLLVPDHWREV